MGRRAPESLVVNEFPTVLSIRSFQRQLTRLIALSLIVLRQQRFSPARVRSVNPVVYPPGRTTSGIRSPFLQHNLFFSVTPWFLTTCRNSFFTFARMRANLQRDQMNPEANPSLPSTPSKFVETASPGSISESVGYRDHHATVPGFGWRES